MKKPGRGGMKDADRIPVAFSTVGPAFEILQDFDVDRRAPA